MRKPNNSPAKTKHVEVPTRNKTQISSNKEDEEKKFINMKQHKMTEIIQ